MTMVGKPNYLRHTSSPSLSAGRSASAPELLPFNMITAHGVVLLRKLYGFS